MKTKFFQLILIYLCLSSCDSSLEFQDKSFKLTNNYEKKYTKTK